MALFRIVYRHLICRTSLFKSATNSYSSELKNKLSKKILEEREKVKEFRKSHGSVVVTKVLIDSIYGGMRDVKTLIYETSLLDRDEGIRFRGYTTRECKEILPKAKGGDEPLPEGMFWLLLTGELPTEEQVAALSLEWAERADLPNHVEVMLRDFPEHLQPMSKFSATITALNTESEFVKAYAKGIKKTEYWEYVFEDAMNLIAKLPVIAAKIYLTHTKSDKSSVIIDPKKDWSANLTQMMGFDDPLFTELMRLYLSIHCDHEGGNVSAHAVHLVGSTLADPYLSFAAGMHGLAGPLHGWASKKMLRFVQRIVKDLGESPTDQTLREYIRNIVKEGCTIPGYYHTVLRVTDPRYTLEREFALKHFPDYPYFKITDQLFKVVPGILQDYGRSKNPWPNVDAQSGVLLYHYGLTYVRFYTVLFGVSRALGTLASLVWDRALGLPIERPKSMSTDELMKLAKEQKVWTYANQ